jgi:hypothetical protein
LLFSGVRATVPRVLRGVFCLVFVCAAACVATQSISLRFARIAVPSTGAPSAQYYVSTSGPVPIVKKVLVYLEGTSRQPATHNFGIGAEASLFGYAIAYSERMYLDDANQFSHAESREQRILETRVVIDDLLSRGAERVLLLAQSEGTMLAPEIAMSLGAKTAGLVCMGGSLNSFRHDLSHSARTRHPRFPWSEHEFDAKLAEIELHPDDRETTFWGHSYHFWSSYLDVRTLETLRGARFPIIYVNGSLDGTDWQAHRAAVNELRAAGVDIESIEYEGVGHELATKSAQLKADLLDWVKRKHL